MKAVASLVLLALAGGCAAPEALLPLEERYPDAHCRHEASVAVTKIACVGCYGNAGRNRAFDELYRQCLAGKP